MDPFELLKADHEKVAQLFDQLESAPGKAKLNVFKEIKSELDLHAHIEETIFYPPLDKSQKTHDLTLEAFEEHKVIKTLLAELAGASSADDEWQAKAKVLRENVEHHVDEEENELFDKAGDVLTDEELEALGNRMEAEKARQQGRPVPKRPAAKAAKSSKAKAQEPGILSKVANFIGLGGGATKKAGEKSSTKKKAAAKKSSKKAAKSTSKGRKAATGKKRSGTAKAARKTSRVTKSASSARKGTKKKAARR